MWNPTESFGRRRTLRPKDLICKHHRRRLQMVGAGSLMDLGRTTKATLTRIRAEMTTCADCTALILDNTDAHK